MNWYIILEIIYFIFIILIASKILIDTESSAKAAAYILLIFILPVVGILIYLSFGLNYRKNEIYTKKLVLDEEQSQRIEAFIQQYKTDYLHQFEEGYSNYYSLGKMLYADNQSISTRNNKVKILQNGENKFPELLQALRKAQHHIHLEYYIYDDDEIGNEIAKILVQKAKEGVEVRFIYDDFGSRPIRKKLIPKLRKAGVEAYAFYKVVFIYLANRLNYRNHRKIAIIDGAYGFIGGINVSDKYINPSKNKTYWRDTHIMVEGEAVWTLQQIFMADWNFCSQQNLPLSNAYFIQHPKTEDAQWVQIISSGPDSRTPSILYSYIQAIAMAKKEICITTPYLIPGQSFLYALYMAVLRGVQVKILVPEVSDSRFVNAICRSYFEGLLENGVEVYLYEKGFVHAKTMVCDDELTVVGTANLDNRSFDLNFEVNAIMYDVELAKQQKAAFNNDLQQARKLHYEEWKKRSKTIRLTEKILRLVAPLI